MNKKETAFFGVVYIIANIGNRRKLEIIKDNTKQWPPKFTSQLFFFLWFVFSLSLNLSLSPCLHQIFEWIDSTHSRTCGVVPFDVLLFSYYVYYLSDHQMIIIFNIEAFIYFHLFLFYVITYKTNQVHTNTHINARAHSHIPSQFK